MSAVPRIVLKKGREKPLLRGHPWVFSGAVARFEGDVTAGAVGEAVSADGQFLGVGHLNPRSQIVFRLLSRNQGLPGSTFLKNGLQRRQRGEKKSSPGRPPPTG